MVKLVDSAAVLTLYQLEWVVTSPAPCRGREWEGTRTLHVEEAQQKISVEPRTQSEGSNH